MVAQGRFKKILSAGVVENLGDLSCELSFLSRKSITPKVISSNDRCYVIERAVTSISSVLWLLGVYEKHDIYKTALVPINKRKVINKISNFVSEIDEVRNFEKVYLILYYKFQSL